MGLNPNRGLRNGLTGDKHQDGDHGKLGEHDLTAQVAPVTDDGANALGNDNTDNPQDIREQQHLAALVIGRFLGDGRQRNRQVGADAQTHQNLTQQQQWEGLDKDHGDGTDNEHRHGDRKDRLAAKTVAQAAAQDGTDGDAESERRGNQAKLTVIETKGLLVNDQCRTRRDDRARIDVGRHARDDGDPPRVHVAIASVSHSISPYNVSKLPKQQR